MDLGFNMDNNQSLIYYLSTISPSILELKVCNEPKKNQGEEKDEKNCSDHGIEGNRDIKWNEEKRERRDWLFFY